MGFALAAATPGIIIPMLNKFKNNSYSKHNKLNEIIIIGASIDDVTALSFFVVFISMASPAGEVGIGTIIAQVPVKLI
jgi:NhaP-type Na+/H+ or K+/H+ antiporter